MDIAATAVAVAIAAVVFLRSLLLRTSLFVPAKALANVCDTGTTLSSIVQPDIAPLEVLRRIWSPAFATYDGLVLNFLSLPQMHSSLPGLCMYVASRAAQCVYCTAQCMSFTVRRGTPGHLASRAWAMSNGESNAEDFSASQVAAIMAGKSLALGTFASEHVLALRGAGLSEDDLEWVRWGVGRGGP